LSSPQVAHPRLTGVREFLIPNPVSSINAAGKARQKDEQRNIFLAFAHDYFGLPENVAVVGLQCSYGHPSGDQFIVLQDDGGSLCLPIALLMEPVEIARELVKEKLKKFEASF
jgi:hypothetical protein